MRAIRMLFSGAPRADYARLALLLTLLVWISVLPSPRQIVATGVWAKNQIAGIATTSGAYLWQEFIPDDAQQSADAAYDDVGGFQEEVSLLDRVWTFNPAGVGQAAYLSSKLAGLFDIVEEIWPSYVDGGGYEPEPAAPNTSDDASSYDGTLYFDPTNQRHAVAWDNIVAVILALSLMAVIWRNAGYRTDWFGAGEPWGGFGCMLDGHAGATQMQGWLFTTQRRFDAARTPIQRIWVFAKTAADLPIVVFGVVRFKVENYVARWLR